MSLVNKINKQTKYCLQNYKHFSCEMCPVRLLAVSLTNKKFSPYFKNTYDYYKAIKSSLTLAKVISANKI